MRHETDKVRSDQISQRRNKTEGQIPRTKQKKHRGSRSKSKSRNKGRAIQESIIRDDDDVGQGKTGGGATAAVRRPPQSPTILEISGQAS